MKRATLLMACWLALPPAGQAAQLEGVTLPDSHVAEGSELRLNGIALRTFSILRIHIYVAGLYLPHPDHDADRILQSDEPKFLDIHFVHEVSAEQARTAWREGFAQNCLAPCRLAPEDMQRFMAAVPAMREGDRFGILFNRDGADIVANGHAAGRIASRAFATAVLATFIGPNPPTARLKRELLGLPEPPARVRR